MRPRTGRRITNRQMPSEIKPAYKPHPAQRIFHFDPHRFRVIAAGRRWGKTIAGLMELWRVLQAAKEPTPIGWIVAPNYPLSAIDWDAAWELMNPGIIRHNINDRWMEVVLGNNRYTKIEFKSAERKDEGLRGRGLSGLLIDECGMVSREAWELGLRPALADKQGKGIFISTPKGRGLFYELWRNAETDSDWQSWQFPSISNPYFPKEEWDKLEKITPKLVWQQEYLAEFLEDSSTVFHGLSLIEGATPRGPEPGDRFSIGVDLAKSVDFTVIAVLDQKGHLVHLHRSKDNEWSLQKKRIETLHHRYRPSRVVMDSSGIGDPMEEQLRKSGISVFGIKTNSPTVKTELIEGLIVAIEQQYLRLPSEKVYPDYRWLWEELRSFGMEVLESGHVRYQAPDGYHDDGVIALSLAVKGASWLGQKSPEPRVVSPYTTWKEYNRLTDPKRKRQFMGGYEVRPWITVKVA